MVRFVIHCLVDDGWIQAAFRERNTVTKENPSQINFFFQRGGQPKGKENEIDGPVWETTFNGQDYFNVNSSRKHSGV